MPNFASNPGPIHTIRFRRWNHVDPLIRVSLRPREQGGFWYEYAVENGASASQAICIWDLIVLDLEFVSDREDPPSWKQTFRPPQKTPTDPRALYYINPLGYFVNWIAHGGPPEATACGTTSGAIFPGSTATFKISGPAKPGYLRAFFLGLGDVDPTMDMPNEVALEIEPYLTLEGSSQRRLVIGPAFALDTPKSVMANALLDSVKELIEDHKLEAQSAFVREAVQLLQTATGGSSANAAPETGTTEIKFETQPMGELERELRSAIQVDLE